jgi:antibiotic biosynthesis monooxygenase (ABM) superfamily enzyme
MAQSAVTAPVSRLRLTLAIAACVYPLVTLILILLGPTIAPWPAWQKALMIVPLVVPTMVWAIIPAIYRWLGPWLRSTQN